jgi:AcrR family transcriptional regulator
VARRVPRGQETRERILAAALRRFAERGYAAVSIEEIAETAGVTKGAVYHWFSDKDDLGRELQHELYERLSAATMHTFTPGDDAVSNMIRSFDAYLALLGDLGEARFFLRDAWVIPALDEAGRHDHEDAVELIRGVLATAIKRGELVDLDPDLLARVVTGVFAEATLHVLRTGSRAGTEAVVAHLLGSLRVRPPAAPGLQARSVEAADGER